MTQSTTEPDPRFTLANERTFLAWIRTSLALLAGGVALAEMSARHHPTWLWTAVSVAPVMTGTVLSVLAYVHWRRCMAALRSGSPLPPPSFAIGLTVLICVTGIILMASFGLQV